MTLATIEQIAAIPMPNASRVKVMALIAALQEAQNQPSPTALRKRRERVRKRDMGVTSGATCHGQKRDMSRDMSHETPPPSPPPPSSPTPPPTPAPTPAPTREGMRVCASEGVPAREADGELFAAQSLDQIEKSPPSALPPPPPIGTESSQAQLERLAREASAVAPPSRLREMPGYGPFLDAWREWCDYRTDRACAGLKSQRVPWTRTAAKNALLEIERVAAGTGLEPITARVREAMAGSWQGLNLSKMDWRPPPGSYRPAKPAAATDPNKAPWE